MHKHKHDIHPEKQLEGDTYFCILLQEICFLQ